MTKRLPALLLPSAFAFALALPARAADPGTALKTATAHAMKYHLSLPQGWTSAKTWPVALLIPDASRDFEGTLSAFVKARGALPWILVAPHVVTNGGANYRLADTYRYSEADFSSAPARADLPVKVLFCDRAKVDAPVGWDAWIGQSKDAMKLAEAHGFRNVSLANLPGRPHGPLADDVIAFFETVRLRRGP